MSATYGTVPTKGADVESDVEARMALRVQSSLSELVAEVKFGRSLMMTALFTVFLLCASTFTMVVLATNYSKETVIVSGVMTEKATNNVVATAEHTEVIPSPLSLNGAQGVKRITISKTDGTIISHRVESASRVSCKGLPASFQDVCNTDMYFYLFDTNRGTYAGLDTPAGLKFQLLPAGEVDAIKANSSRPKVSKATGKAF